MISRIWRTLTCAALLTTASLASAASVGPDTVLSSAIKEADGTTGQETNAGSGVKTGHLQDGAVTAPKLAPGAVGTAAIATGAVTDAQISGSISGAKLGAHAHGQADVLGLAEALAVKADVSHGHDGVYQRRPAGVVVVAKSGGDFTSIADAVASVSPTADAPVTVQVMPGTYEEGRTIWLKSDVTIAATPGTVTIRGPFNSYPLFQASGASNVVLTGLTLDGGLHCIRLDDCANVRIVDNFFYDFDNYAVLEFRSTVSVERNVFTRTRPTIVSGIAIVLEGGSADVRGNRFDGKADLQAGTGMASAMNVGNARCTVMDNLITDIYGAALAFGYSTAVVVGNYVTSNLQSLSDPDLYFSQSTALVSNNVLMRGVLNQFSTIRGKFNSDVSGNEIVLP